MSLDRGALLPIGLLLLCSLVLASDSDEQGRPAEGEACSSRVLESREALMESLSVIALENTDPLTTRTATVKQFIEGLVQAMASITPACRHGGAEAASLVADLVHDLYVQFANSAIARTPSYPRFDHFKSMEPLFEGYIGFLKDVGITEDDLKKANGPLWSMISRLPMQTFVEESAESLRPYRMPISECQRFYTEWNTNSAPWFFHPLTYNTRSSMIRLSKMARMKLNGLELTSYCNWEGLTNDSFDEFSETCVGSVSIGFLWRLANKNLKIKRNTNIFGLTISDKSQEAFVAALPAALNPSSDVDVAGTLSLLEELARMDISTLTSALSREHAPGEGMLVKKLFDGVIKYIASLESSTKGAKSLANDLTKFVKANFGKKTKNHTDAKLLKTLHLRSTIKSFSHVSKLFFAVSRTDLFTQNHSSDPTSIKKTLELVTTTVPGLTFHKSLSLNTKDSRAILEAMNIVSSATLGLAAIMTDASRRPLLNAVTTSLSGKKASEKLTRFALLMLYTFHGNGRSADNIATASRLSTGYVTRTDKGAQRSLMKTIASLASLKVSECGTESERVVTFNFVYYAVKGYVQRTFDQGHEPESEPLDAAVILRSIDQMAPFACSKVSFAKGSYDKFVGVMTKQFDVDYLMSPWLMEGLYNAMFPDKQVSLDQFENALQSEANPLRMSTDIMAYHLLQLNEADGSHQEPEVLTGSDDEIEEYTYAQVGKIETILFRDILGLGSESFEDFRASSPDNVKIMEPFNNHIRNVWLRNEETVDDPAWLFNMGEWTEGSCQAISSSEVYYNTGVVGTMASANMRLMAASSHDLLGEAAGSKTPIASRCVIRILKHEDYDAVVLIDRAYFGKWLSTEVDARQEVFDIMAAKAAKLVERLSDEGRYRIALINAADEAMWEVAFSKLGVKNLPVATPDQTKAFKKSELLMTGSIGPTYLDVNGGLFEGRVLISNTFIQDNAIRVSAAHITPAGGAPPDFGKPLRGDVEQSVPDQGSSENDDWGDDEKSVESEGGMDHHDERPEAFANHDAPPQLSWGEGSEDFKTFSEGDSNSAPSRVSGYHGSGGDFENMYFDVKNGDGDHNSKKEDDSVGDFENMYFDVKDGDGDHNSKKEDDSVGDFENMYFDVKDGDGDHTSKKEDDPTKGAGTTSEDSWASESTGSEDLTDWDAILDTENPQLRGNIH